MKNRFRRLLTYVVSSLFLPSIGSAAEPSAQPGAAEPAPSSNAIETGLGLGVALHSGKPYSNYGVALPAMLDVGLRLTDFEIGAYGVYSPMLKATCAGVCPDRTSSTVSRAGLLGRLAFDFGKQRLWAGATLGLVWVKTREYYSNLASGPHTYEGGDVGIEYGLLLGVDFLAAKQLRVGPFVSASSASYIGDTTRSAGWYVLGVRGSYDLEL